MTNFYLDLMIITASTVGKIILSSSAGMLVSQHFVAPENSVKGLSYIAMRVSLPCLLFTNLCFKVTWEQLRKFYWAPLFGCVPMSLGFASSFLVRRLLTKEYQFVVILACTFQNALTFPVSILLNLKGIEWLVGDAVVEAQSYTFLYNLICNIGLYSIGEPLIAWAKQQETQEEEAAKAQRQHLCEAAANTSYNGGGSPVALGNRSFTYPFESPRRALDTEGLPSPTYAGAAAEKRGATAREQLGWYRQPTKLDRPITPPAGSPVVVLTSGECGSDGGNTAAAAAGASKQKNSLAHFRKNVIESLTGGPNMASFLAIAVALIPPLRWLAQSFAGEAIIGGMTLVGEGAIPLQLLVLGCTLVGPPPLATVEGTRENDAPSAEVSVPAQNATNTDEAAVACGGEDSTVQPPGQPPSQPCGAALASPQFIFTWCTIFLRLVLLPAACFLLLHLLVTAGLMPKERPFILAMLVEALSPSAMNSSLICAMYGYHAKDYSRMIFCQYVACVFSTTIWLFIFVLYIERTA